MERMLVAVFDTEKQAYEGLKALNKLDSEGSIVIYSECVVQKNGDGTITPKQAEDAFPIGTFTGTAIGSLIGLLGGPVGLALGASAGFTAGILGDGYVAGVGVNFLTDVSARLKPGKFAVVADINEEWVTPVDSTMEVLGAVVFRSAKSDVEAEQWARSIAELKADIEQLEAESARATGEAKTRIRTKIDELNKKLTDTVAQAKARAEAMHEQAEARMKALQLKAQKANREQKAVLDEQIAAIRREHAERQAKLKTAIAMKLRAAAAKLEKAG